MREKVKNGQSQQMILAGSNNKLRVRSWLRMNAGGVPNTCKSNGVIVLRPSGGFIIT